jgi:hypothetical protein
MLAEAILTSLRVLPSGLGSLHNFCFFQRG